jgi:predicted 3-demethylubiquinone-9 3-methyltransferase (glyoxalase superfamily)
MQKITPFLWFNGNAEEAVNFYLSIFKNAKIRATVPYGDAGPGPKGSIMTIDFELDGQVFTALNGGPHFTFTPAVSFVVRCETQEEVDHYWNKLAEGGEEMPCAWVTDRFGVTWQIVPNALIEMLQDKDPEKARKTMEAMLKMKKIDIAALREAYNS